LLSHEDVKSRAWKTLKWQIANGIQYVRTHVDVSDPTLTALKAMLEVKKEIAPWVDLQIVAFPQEGILSYPNGEKLLDQAMEMGADVVGGIPHFEFTREYGVESMHIAFDIARKYNKQIDIHCDEIDDEQSRFVETVAALALKYDMGEKVTASHTTAMHSYNNAYASRLFRLLKMSKIHFVANPLVNIHLQGRFDTYPKRRGVTRVKEMLKNNINVCFGHDDVFDPWYPLGTANMLQVLHMGLHVCQLMGYGQINDGLKLVTENSGALDKVYHETVKSVTEQIEELKFNTAIAQLMIFVNAANKEEKLYVEYAKGFIQLLAPFAPHLAEELWQAVTQTDDSISYVAWPTYDESKLVEAEVEIVVQIKGKVRAKLVVAKDLSREELQEIALADEKIKSEIAGKEVVKVISVPNKLVNIVVK